MLDVVNNIEIEYETYSDTDDDVPESAMALMNMLAVSFIVMVDGGSAVNTAESVTVDDIREWVRHSKYKDCVVMIERGQCWEEI